MRFRIRISSRCTRTPLPLWTMSEISLQHASSRTTRLTIKERTAVPPDIHRILITLERAPIETGVTRRRKHSRTRACLVLDLDPVDSRTVREINVVRSKVGVAEALGDGCDGEDGRVRVV